MAVPVSAEERAEVARLFRQLQGHVPNIFRALATHQNALIQQIYRQRTVAQGKRRIRDIISRDVEGCVYGVYYY